MLHNIEYITFKFLLVSRIDDWFQLKPIIAVWVIGGSMYDNSLGGLEYKSLTLTDNTDRNAEAQDEKWR